MRFGLIVIKSKVNREEDTKGRFAVTRREEHTGCAGLVENTFRVFGFRGC